MAQREPGQVEMQTYNWEAATASGTARKKVKRTMVTPPWPTAKIQFIDDNGPTFTVCWVDRNLS